MQNKDQNHLDFCRYSPWDDCENVLSLTSTSELPDSCLFPDDGIPQRNLDVFFDYQCDLMLEAETTLRSILGLLVDFRQKRKLWHFLLGFCDFLEISCDITTGVLKECRFQIDFSNRISLRYSSRMCGCIILLDGKQDSFHRISPFAIDDLRRILTETWEDVRAMPIWHVISERGQEIQLRPRYPLSFVPHTCSRL